MSTPPTDYSELCGDDLRDLCRGRGLPSGGTMSELRERLRADGARRSAAAATPTPTPTPPPEPPLYLVIALGQVAYLGNDHTAAEIAYQGAPAATMYLCAATQRHIHGTWTSTAAFHIEQQWRGARDERDHARDLLRHAMRVITEAAFRARDRGDRAEADELCAEVASLRRG